MVGLSKYFTFVILLRDLDICVQCNKNMKRQKANNHENIAQLLRFNSTIERFAANLNFAANKFYPHFLKVNRQPLPRSDMQD